MTHDKNDKETSEITRKIQQDVLRKVNIVMEIYEKIKGRFIPPTAFCDQITRRRCERKRERRGGRKVWVVGWGVGREEGEEKLAVQASSQFLEFLGT